MYSGLKGTRDGEVRGRLSRGGGGGGSCAVGMVEWQLAVKGS